jgi:hypothetical protein
MSAPNLARQPGISRRPGDRHPTDPGNCSLPPHPALIALACLLGRAAAREVFRQMREAAPADSGPTQH